MPVSKVVYGDSTLIDLTSDTVTAETLLAGATAHRADGELIPGTYAPTGSDTKGRMVFVLFSSNAYAKRGTLTVNGDIQATNTGTNSASSTRIFIFESDMTITGDCTISVSESLSHTHNLYVFFPASLIPAGKTVTANVNTEETGGKTFTRESLEALGVEGVRFDQSTTSGTLTLTLSIA